VTYILKTTPISAFFVAFHIFVVGELTEIANLVHCLIVTSPSTPITNRPLNPRDTSAGMSQYADGMKICSIFFDNQNAF